MKNDLKKIESLLMNVQRPGRYAGNEINIIRKKDDPSVEVKFVLAYPDLYELGIPNLGLQILYHILNKRKWIRAERVFSPWKDMEKKMRENRIPLFSLETQEYVKNSDVFGITLQYELHYSNIINLLDLSGIPVWQKERNEEDPLIIAGGPCSFNPEPLSDFLDAVVIGDGEEIIIEIAFTIRSAKRNKLSRKATLKKLSRLKGVYIPSLYKADKNSGQILPVRKDETIPQIISSRIIEKLSTENYPSKPLVPLINVIHDRYSIEIMRGCSNGCRFCNAGIIYRPVREKKMIDIIDEAQKAITSTGYDEISLSSLSTADYSSLPELLLKIRKILKSRNVSLTFPSLRADSFTENIAGLCTDFRKNGITLAPEAGTQRLRNVINKNITEENILKAVKTAYKMGWSRIKLYFMIGLPTETSKDLDGIIEMTKKILYLGKQFGKKEIHISISPFSPKPWTPFQWEKQEDSASLESKINYLKKNIRQSNVKISWTDPKISKLEAILGRGDRKLSQVIYQAWINGARFDGWSDEFNFTKWTDAFNKTGITMENYLFEKNPADHLPWDHLKKGVTKKFLLKERDKAYIEQTTENCRDKKCNGCGIADNFPCKKTASPKIIFKPSNKIYLSDHREKKLLIDNNVKHYIRLVFSKGPDVRFTSHLEVIRIFQHAFRKSRLPLAFSQGYHPRPKISPGPPLPLGYISCCEYLDVQLLNIYPNNFESQLNKYLPEGIEVLKSKQISKNTSSLNSSITLAIYQIDINLSLNFEKINKNIDTFLKNNYFKIVRKRKGKKKTIDIRTFVDKLYLEKNILHLSLRFISQRTARVDEILNVILPDSSLLSGKIIITRTGLYISTGDKRISPMKI